MTFYVCAALAVLLIAGLSGAMLPFVSVWDHRLATARRRSLYDKGAGQTESFTAVLEVLFALALAADLLARGYISRLMTGPWAFVWECLVIAASVAALCAVRLCPAVREYLVPSHASYEIGYGRAMEEIGLSPLLLLDMRLGEGSGCPISFKIIEAAAAAMNGMATFAEGSIDADYLDERKKGNFF